MSKTCFDQCLRISTFHGYHIYTIPLSLLKKDLKTLCQRYLTFLWLWERLLNYGNKSDISSAKILAFVVKPSGKLLTYTKSSKDPPIEHCGTPVLIFDQLEH